MIPWEHLDSTQVPGDGRQLSLHRRDKEFSIRVGGVELMNSRVYGSEEALAELACAKIRDRADARILIGGLGMGFTVSAALGLLGAKARVVVAELVPAVVDWNRKYQFDPAGRPLKDRRASVKVTDVAQIIRSEREAYDAILLDVDNFKNYNDKLGHPAGDRALKKVAELIKTSTRKSDIAVRYGGEEFCIILPMEDIQAAKQFGERLRKKIETYEFYKREVQPAGKVTVSLG
ncbi:hypothetical protein LCGC14_3054670, partial [marine sediment metagenome]